MSNIEETKMTDEAFNELMDNFEVVGHLTEYGRKEIKQKVKEMQARIKELEEENRIFKNKNVLVNRYFKLKDNSIPKQKVKDILNEIQEEYDKVQEQFDCIWNKKSKDNYDRYKLQELSAMQQELGFILGKFEKLLEEGE